MSKARLWAVWGVAGLVLAGCVNLGGGKAPPQLLRFSAVSVPATGTTLSASPQDVLVVAEPDAERPLTISRVAVQVDATAIAYMKGGVWSERPTRLFRNLLAETLRARGKRLVMQDDAETPKGAPRIEGRLLFLGYDARSHAAVVRYDALQRRPDGTILMRRFEASEPDIAPNVAAVGPALNRAANAVAVQVADWVLANAPAPTGNAPN